MTTKDATESLEVDLNSALQNLRESRTKLMSVAKRIIHSARNRPSMLEGMNGTAHVSDLSGARRVMATP